jgi:hypothetical protein
VLVAFNSGFPLKLSYICVCVCVFFFHMRSPTDVQALRTIKEIVYEGNKDSLCNEANTTQFSRKENTVALG